MGEIMIEEVAPGVYSAPHQVVEGQNAIVFGQKNALAIDGGMYPQDGDAMAAFIRDRGHQPDRLALTHGHGDHVLGARALAGGEVFAHRLTPGVIRDQVPGWADKWGETEANVAADLPWPTVTFQDDLCTDLGGRTVRWLHTPGHSPDSASALVVEEGVLIAGDAVVTAIVPAISAGDGRELEQSLRRLVQLEAEVLIPGHGHVVHGRDAVRGWLLWEAEYLATARDLVRTVLGRGGDLEVAVEEASLDECASGRLPIDEYSMPKRHRSVIEKIISEEQETERGE